MASSLTSRGGRPGAKLTSAASASVHRLGGWPNVRGLWCNSARKAALVQGMHGMAHRLVGAVQVTCHGGGRLPLGTGEEDLAAADGKGGRGPETGLQCCPLVRRERAYK